MVIAVVLAVIFVFLTIACFEVACRYYWESEVITGLACVGSAVCGTLFVLDGFIILGYVNMIFC